MVPSAPQENLFLLTKTYTDVGKQETVVGKYCNHTPLHRQSMILERDLGFEISRATLDA